MVKQIETIIVGGGQAGLAASYHLTQHGREHLVLEQAAQAGNAWRNDRWDSFTLLTPNWSFLLPGAEYQGEQPGGFMPQAEIVAAFESYVDRYKLPVRYGEVVETIEQTANGRYTVRTEDTSLEARNIIVATGLYQKPRIPAFAAQLSTRLTQLPAGQYRHPQALPPGAVLVVGSGQSGTQIAEELCQHGRRVYLSTGSAGRAPRRYRGKDVFEWLKLSGFFERTPDKLPSPQARFSANPHISGTNGGHTLNLHQFAHDGMILLGHLRGGDENSLFLVPDLNENLRKADKFETELVRMIDQYIAQHRLDAPPEALPSLGDGFVKEELSHLDVRATGIASLIWACGYTFDFSMVRLPVFDNYGFPIQVRGQTSYPGLYFLGLPWLHTQKSGLLMGVGEDAQIVANAIAQSA